MRSYTERPLFIINAVLAGLASVILLIVASVLIFESLFPSSSSQINEETSSPPVFIFIGILAVVTVIFIAWISKYEWKLLAVSIVAVFGGAVVATFIGRSLTVTPMDFPSGIVPTLVNILMFITIALVYGQTKGNRHLFASFMTIPEPKRLFLLPALLWIASLLLIFGVVSLLPEYLQPVSNVNDVLVLSGQNLPLAILVVGIFTPIGEEVFFRGFLLRMLSKRFTGTVSVVLSSVLFALFHINYRLFIPIFILGVALGLAFMWTRSIWPPIIIHMAQNITGLVISTLDLPI